MYFLLTLIAMGWPSTTDFIKEADGQPNGMFLSRNGRVSNQPVKVYLYCLAASLLMSRYASSFPGGLDFRCSSRPSPVC